MALPLRLALPFLAACFAWPLAARADALGAGQARDAIERGARAWDVRGPKVTRLLPGAVQADLGIWARTGALADLARAVSAAGIDLSRDVVVYGTAGDAGAQALVAALSRVATGQVHWLVGGIDEWQAAGLPTATRAMQRPPVPQHLVAHPVHDNSDAAAQPAAPTLRRSVTAPGLLAARD